MRAAARLLPGTLRGCRSCRLRGSPTSRPTSRPQCGQQAACPAPLPASAVIAEGFVHMPKESRFFFFPPCISAWQCNLVIPASAACRCSFMSSGKMLSQRSRLPRCRVPTFPCQPLLTAILGCWQETLILVAKLFSRLTLPPSLSSLPGTIGVSLFSLARRSGAWRERGGPTVCAGPAGAPGCGQSPARLPGESSSVPRAAGPTPRDCAGQRLCPMGRRRGRFLRCLHPTSSGQAASLKPSSSRARKAAKQNRCASLCRENSGDSVSTCAGEGADRLAGPLSAYPA